MNKKQLTEFAIGIAIGAGALYFIKRTGLVTFIDRVDPTAPLIVGGGGHY